MRRNRGFTLLELVIVIGVIAILAALALPAYNEYVRKGKRGEGAAALGDISLREERWRADNPSYGTMTELFGTAPLAATYNSQYKYYTVAISGQSATGYTATATRKGDLANDPKCGDLTLTMLSGAATKGVSSGDPTYCWRQ